MPRVKEEIIFEWAKPKKLCKEEAYKMMREGKTSVPRIIIITALLEIICYFVLVRIVPIDSGINLHKILSSFLVIFVGVIIIAPVLYFLAPWMEALSPLPYRITTESIIISRTSGRKRSSLKWADILGYKIERHSVYPDINSVRLWTKKAQMTLWLPEDNRAQEIINLVSSNISSSGNLPAYFEMIELKNWETAYFWLLTIAYTAAVGLGAGTLFGPDIMQFFVFTLFLGPGTIGLIILYGKRAFKNKYLLVQVMPFNFIAMILVMATIILFKFLMLRIEMGL